jgi:excinuclease ABC subunit A
LNYLSLDRCRPILFSGEAQRIRIASQIGSELTGVLYILDEPTTGLHFKDNDNLLNIIQKRTKTGNTLLVIEHNLDVIICAG